MKGILCFLATLFLSQGLFAGTPNSALILLRSTSKSIELNYLNFESKETTITIADQFGKVLFQKTKQTPSLLPRQFEFDELNGNQFQIAIENNFRKVKANFQFLGTKAIQLGDSQTYFKPTFTKKGNQVHINLLNPTAGTVTIEVKNRNGKLISPKMKVSGRIVKKIIDFSTYKSGAWIVVNNGERHTYLAL